jgi:hypothetical protein
MTEVGLRLSDPDASGKQSLVWSKDKDVDKEIEFTQTELNFLKKQVDRLDKSEQLSPDLMAIAKAVKGL